MDINNRITETATELFVKHGVRSITMNDIAAEIGISKKTLYEHFLNKDDLLVKCLDSLHETAKSEREEIFSKDGFTIDSMLEITRKSAVRINLINPNFITDIKKYHPQIWKNKLKKMENDTIEFKVWMIKEGIKKGLFRHDLNADIVSKLLHEQINLLINDDAFPADRFSRSEVFQTMMGIFGRGIASDKMLKKLNKIEKYMSNKSNNF